MESMWNYIGLLYQAYRQKYGNQNILYAIDDYAVKSTMDISNNLLWLYLHNKCMKKTETKNDEDVDVL